MTAPDEKNDAVSYADMTDEQAARWSALVVQSVQHDPERYLTQKITPRASAADLMGGQPPPWWRLIARRRWFARLYKLSHAEMLRQRQLARNLTADQES